MENEYEHRTGDNFEKKCVLFIIDDYSRYAVCYIISSKTEVAQCMEDYCKRAFAMHGKKISKFRLDRGDEFISKEMKSIFQSQSIELQYAETNVHEHNRVSESYNRL